MKGKAWTYATARGGMVENLRLTDYDIPDTKPDHVLIEVLNASLNPGDYKFPDVPILKYFIKYPASPCFDFCGRIRVLPPNLKPDQRNLHVGQIVFGMYRDIKDIGTLKTIMWVHKDNVYPLPTNFPTEHGSALGVGAMTAHQAIAPHAKPGAKILINGATGGVGTFCIQVAKAMDMYVIATCSEAGVKLCQDLGADQILDYKASTFHEDLCRTKVDLVVDNIGYDQQFHRRSLGFLRPDGQFVLVGLMAYDLPGIWSMFVSWTCPTWLGGTPRKWRPVFTGNTLDQCASVAKLAEEGKLKVVVDSVFSFEDVLKAFAKLKTGRTKGKIMINVTDNGKWYERST